MKILAFDIGGTAIKSAIVDEKGNISQFSELPTPERIIDGVLSAASQYEGYDAAGVSTAGIVDTEKGVIVFSSAVLGYYDGEPLGREIENGLGKPAFIENDVNCAALGEAAFGAGRGLSDFICLTYGTAIGGAVFMDGRLYRGRKGMAGEIGHMVTHADGRPCPCGQRGCYSEYASASALVREAMAIDEKYSSGRVISENLQDERLYNAVCRWADEAAIGLASVTHIFDPSALILGGGIMNDRRFIEIIRDKLSARLMPSYRDVKVIGAETGSRAGLLGAAHNAFERMAL